jgi:hypothetical protein
VSGNTLPRGNWCVGNGGRKCECPDGKHAAVLCARELCIDQVKAKWRHLKSKYFPRHPVTQVQLMASGTILYLQLFAGQSIDSM